MSQISASILIDILIKYILIKKKECIRISFVYTATLRPQQVIENDVFDPVLVKVQFVVVVVFAVNFIFLKICFAHSIPFSQ